MARIGFHGFKAGTAVELVLHKFGRRISAAAESWNAPDITDPDAEDPSPDDWSALPATATVEVTAHRSDLEVGPEGFLFKVIAYDGFDTPAPAAGETYDRRYHKLVYLWDFDDPGARWTHPVNVMEHQRDANVGYGPHVGHTYTKPGTYSPSVIVYEPSSGKLAKHVLGPFTVQDPDVVFAGARTSYVHPAGDYSAAPAGARTFSDFKTAMSNAKTGSPHRVMLAAGQTFETSGQYITGGGTTRLRNTYICAAAGPKPTIRHVGSDPAIYSIDKSPRENPNDGLDLVLTGFDLIGQWDTSSETGTSKSGVTFSWKGNPLEKARYCLLDDVVISGFNQGVSYLSEQEMTTVIHNSTITNWQDYAIWAGSDRMALLGLRATQDPDAMGGGFKNGAHNQHGCMRNSATDYAVMDGCDFFTYNGWFENIPPYHTQQPVLRWNFLGHESHYAMELNFQRCSCEGGETILSFQHMNTNTSVDNQNVLIEMCVLVGSHMTNTPIKTAFGGVTVRNNILIQPDIPRINFHLFCPRGAVQFENHGTIGGEAIDPIVCEHNTYVNLMSSVNLSRNKWNASGTPFLAPNLITAPLPDGKITERYNIIHQPNLAVPETPYGPLNTTPIWEPRSEGYKDGGGESITLDTDIPNGGSIKIPHKGTYEGLSASAFENGNHFLRVIGGKSGFSKQSSHFSVVFDNKNAVVKNTSGVTWSSGILVEYKWDRSRGDNPVQRDRRLGTPKESVAIFAPLKGSNALGAGHDGAEIVLDFYGKRRPAYPSIGALESFQ